MAQPPPLGAHLSIAGGVWKAVERAHELGCTALQIFTQAPGRWEGLPITPDAASRFREAAAEEGLDGVTFAHAPYLINVATADRALLARSTALLEDQLRRARDLGLAGVVLHPGAHGGEGAEVGLERAAAALTGVLGRTAGCPRLLLEVTAGQGTVLCSAWDELGALLSALPAGRTGVCWDTAHLWGSGHDIASAAGWRKTWDGFTAATGCVAPDLVHLNDTNVELGSHRDRHERIGLGRLGERTFARVVRDKRLAQVPMVLETPKGPDEVTWDREALELLRELHRRGRGGSKRARSETD